MDITNKIVLFFDLDGTIINTISGKTFPAGVWDMEIDLRVLSELDKLKPAYVFIVSNQGGVGRGFVNQKSFAAKFEYVKRAIFDYLGDNSIIVDGMYCTNDDKANEYRKPNTAMLETLLRKYSILNAKETMLMVGDASGKPGDFSDSDKKTAENFGIDYLDVEDFISLN
jgi:DNA 3'-phosphatase